MVKPFDEAFVTAAADRLAALPPDQAPAWGSMRPPQVLAHLTIAVRYSLNKEPLVPREWGWLGQYVVKPIFLSGLLPKPKGAKAPKFYENAEAEGSAEALKAESCDFLQQCAAGGLKPPEHPVFGPLTLDEWNRLHRIHFEHHLKQFGIEL